MALHQAIKTRPFVWNCQMELYLNISDLHAKLLVKRELFVHLGITIKFIMVLGKIKFFFKTNLTSHSTVSPISILNKPSKYFWILKTYNLHALCWLSQVFSSQLFLLFLHFGNDHLLIWAIENFGLLSLKVLTRFNKENFHISWGCHCTK